VASHRFGFVKRPKITNVYCTTPGSTLQAYSRVCVIADSTISYLFEELYASRQILRLDVVCGQPHHGCPPYAVVYHRRFPVAAARFWNGLPPHVTSAPSLPVFRSRLETHLFRRCFPWLHLLFFVVPVKWLVIIGHVNRSFYLLTYLPVCHSHTIKMKQVKNYWYRVLKRSSADADNSRVTRLAVSQCHQTLYHSIC